MYPAGSPRLIINADDFGLTPGINRAIAELHRAGVLSSATLMATGPAFQDAAAISLEHPTLGVGCHLVFVDGRPLSPPASIPSLLGPDGTSFRSSLGSFASAALRGAIHPGDLARETEAQIQRLQRAGLTVTHFDSHKHTHVFPAIAPAVRAAAARCGVIAFRNPFEPRWSRRLSTATLLRRAQLAVLQRLQPRIESQLLAAESPVTTAGTLGILATGHLNAQTLEALLRGTCTHADEGVYELCTHPGYNDDALARQPTRLRNSREQEYQALLKVVPRLFNQPGQPALIHYGALTPAAPS